MSAAGKCVLRLSLFTSYTARFFVYLVLDSPLRVAGSGIQFLEENESFLFFLFVLGVCTKLLFYISGETLLYFFLFFHLIRVCAREKKKKDVSFEIALKKKALCLR